MPVQVEKLPDSPVIILTYEGHMDVETVKSAFSQSAVIAASVEGTVYRISDVRNSEGNFADVVNVIKAIRENKGCLGGLGRTSPCRRLRTIRNVFG